MKNIDNGIMKLVKASCKFRRITQKNVLKISASGKWEKVSTKKDKNSKEPLKAIAEEEDAVESMDTEEIETEDNEENQGQEENEYGEKGEEEKSESGTIMKMLVTKKHISTEDDDDQDIIIETCRCAQAIVEHWIQENQIEGVKDKFEEGNEFIKEVTDCNQWMSEPKAI